VIDPARVKEVMFDAVLEPRPEQLSSSKSTPLIEFSKTSSGRMVARIPRRYVLPAPIAIAIQQDLESFTGKRVDEFTYTRIACTIREWLEQAVRYGLLFEKEKG